MFSTAYSQLGGLVWMLVCALAVWRGGRAERIAGLALVLGWVASLAVQGWTAGPAYWPVAVIDLLLLLLFVALAWRTPRSWPSWAALFQLVLVASHVAMAMDGRIGPRAYVTTLNVIGFAVLGALAYGLFESWRAKRAVGAA